MRCTLIFRSRNPQKERKLLLGMKKKFCLISIMWRGKGTEKMERSQKAEGSGDSSYNFKDKSGREHNR